MAAFLLPLIFIKWSLGLLFFHLKFLTFPTSLLLLALSLHLLTQSPSHSSSNFLPIFLSLQSHLLQISLCNPSMERDWVGRRKSHKVKYLVHKKRTISSGVSMSSSSNLVEFDNANGEKEHSANPTKLKRQKLSASSSGFRAGHDGGQPIRVLRSRKRLQEVGTATSTHHQPCTVLSWLIDNNVVQPTEKVHYCSTKGSHPMAQGKLSRKGIICNCCEEVFSLSGFQSHAGCSNHRPAANIFIEDGKSLLDCQMQIMIKRTKRICGPELHDMMKDNSRGDKNDSICTVCQDGGDLILCDLCPSAFHKSCIGLKDVPDGDWFCPACCCGICGCSIEPTIHYHTCGQCERKYHTGCLRKRSVDNLESDPKGKWFCSDNCKKIFLGLHERLGKKIPVGIDNLTWSLSKSLKSDSDNTNGPDNDAVTESYSRLSLALQVMQECFKHFKQPHTTRDLAEDIIFSRGSDLNGMNFQGFYTVVLDKNDEIITVATVRIYGAKVAEVPLLGTRLQYRRRGMCHALLNLLEKMLMDLGVERLILPVVSSSLRKWNTSFGYSNMKYSDRLQLLDYRFMDFQDTVMCQKPLLRIPLAEPQPSTGIPLDISGSVDDIDFNRSSGDNISFTWTIDNFSSFCKQYSETFLIGDLRWRMLMYPKGNTVDNLSVYLDVQGASELPLGWSRCVQFSFTVVNQLQRCKSIRRETKHVFNKKVSNCGFTSLIPLDELHDLSKGYLVNDTCIIEANVAVCMVEIKISQDPKTGSSIPRPVEYSNQGHKEQGPPLDMGSMNVPGPSSAARKGTLFENVTAFQDAASSEQACTEISDSSTDPSLNMESSEVADLASAARKATDFEHVAASPTASYEQISDTSTDAPLVEEFDVVSSSSASELMDFRGLAKIKKDFVPLLEKVCSWNPSLVECQKNSPQFTEWAFTALGKVLHFLKTKKVKDMTRSGCQDLELLWNELKAFKFDLTWLEPHVERALGMSKFVEGAAELKRLREDVNALEIESKRVEAKLVVARNDLKKAEEAFDERTMDSALGYSYC